jgi:NADH-quinone oxidoreductase subunit L
LIPALPIAGALILTFFGGFLPRRVAFAVGVSSVGLSAFLAVVVGLRFAAASPPGGMVSTTLWHWIEAGGLIAEGRLRLDALSLVMTLVVTFVSFLIHVYSAAYMRDDEGYRRFFAYMNLFVGAMLILVLADDLLLLLLGWEGVGLCSYLLIGFWYKDPKNGYAAQKAFIVTRLGDIALIVGLLLLFHTFKTLAIPAILGAAPEEWAVGSAAATLAAVLLLGGALGKSAQLPLQVWLPDAMAGPTPVSALIHAATMVTAGVYLIARLHVLFLLAPYVQATVAWIGAATLLIASFSALTETDLKRILAYSTISQIGYMFLALGVGAWSPAIFHFVTHAFFKALLFLGAGVVIMSVDDEHNIFAMGGLRKKLPVTFWSFLAGAASLAAMPLVTAGSYSKDMILDATWKARAIGGPWLWFIGILGAFLSSLYAFRMVIVVFFGDAKKTATHEPSSWELLVPLMVLAIFSVAGGLVDHLPAVLSTRDLTTFLETVLPATSESTAYTTLSRSILSLVAPVVSLLGVAAAYVVYGRRRFPWVDRLIGGGIMQTLKRYFQSGWGFDWLYDRVIVRPFLWLAAIGRCDVIDRVYVGIAALARGGHHALSLTQSGRLRWYVTTIAWGAAALVAVAVFL